MDASLAIGEAPEETFHNDKYLDESRLLNSGTSSEESGTLSYRSICPPR